ncbi:MAG: ATP-binding protein [Actinomycetota bacterium]|nr:ATP-binding protein [Actinomycetota bacterium]
MMSPNPTIVVVLEGSISSINQVHEGLAELWRRHPRISGADRMAFETALIELATNVIRHSLRAESADTELRLAVGVTELSAEIIDNGPEFRGYLDHFALPGLSAESGRGMAVIDSLMDVFEYTRVPAQNSWTPAQNHWRIIRRLTVPVGT